MVLDKSYPRGYSKCECGYRYKSDAEGNPRDRKLKKTKKCPECGLWLPQAYYTPWWAVPEDDYDNFTKEEKAEIVRMEKECENFRKRTEIKVQLGAIRILRKYPRAKSHNARWSSGYANLNNRNPVEVYKTHFVKRS